MKIALVDDNPQELEDLLKMLTDEFNNIDMNRITSYNVCYTKLLRVLLNIIRELSRYNKKMVLSMFI